MRCASLKIALATRTVFSLRFTLSLRKSTGRQAMMRTTLRSQCLDVVNLEQKGLGTKKDSKNDNKWQKHTHTHTLQRKRRESDNIMRKEWPKIHKIEHFFFADTFHEALDQRRGFKVELGCAINHPFSLSLFVFLCHTPCFGRPGVPGSSTFDFLSWRFSWWTFRIYIFFFLFRGGGEGGSVRGGGRGGQFFIKK